MADYLPQIGNNGIGSAEFGEASYGNGIGAVPDSLPQTGNTGIGSAEFGQASNGGGSGMPPSSTIQQQYSSYSNDDFLDGVTPSTLAMIMLFGSIMFATVGMATRAWLWGDKRAIYAAMSVDVNSSASNINNNNGGKYSYVRSDEHAGNNSHSISVASRMTRVSVGTTATNTRIHPWEPTFISTFVLLCQVTFFGLILFTVYLIDNHPLHGEARSQTANAPASNLEFDEDQFLFWIFMLIAYGYFVSWNRNDGRPNGHKTQLPRPSEPSSTQKTAHIVRRRQNASFRHTTAASVGSKSSVSRASSETSDASKRLEDVLLDDEASFNNILDTIDDDIIKNKKDVNVGWLEQASIFLGIHHVSENDASRTVEDAKPDEDVLNRYQTLELKGLLSVALLMYRYNNGGSHKIALNNEDHSEDGAMGSRAHVYENLTKVGVTSFLFMAGFGHTSYFYYHPANNLDIYSVSRVLAIIFRINWSAIFLSLVIGKAEYTACPMNTYCFLLVWLTMWLQSYLNYDKFQFRLKLFWLAACIFIIWDCDISKAFSNRAVQSTSPMLWEWYCSSHLHHWSAYCGMIFAINQPIASLQLRKLESLHVISNVMAKGLILVALSAAVMVWSAGPLQMPIWSYNISHPYFGIIPLLMVVYMRNMCSALREHHIGVLSSLGKYSLEIYLLHYHAFNDSGCIIFIPGYPRCNLLLVSMLLLFAARALHHLTIILRHMLLPENDESKCIQNSSFTVAGITLLYSLAKGLTWAGMVSVGTISTITIVFGLLLYQSILDMAWADYRDSGVKPGQHQRHSSDPSSGQLDADESPTAKIRPPLIGTVVFVIAWCLWIFSSTTSQPCGATANNGKWVRINPCLARGRLHREFHATNYIAPNECSEAKTNLQWTWLENSQHRHCKYRYRNDMEVQLKLRGKNVVFIGDSSVRSLFQSLCRFMGEHNAGMYEDTTPSHSDAVKTYGTSSIEYKWAPLGMDIVTKLKTFRSSGYGSSLKRQPDLVIAGGGAWDKMHLSVTDEDPQSQRQSILKLAKSLSEVDVPVIWFTPPTINTRALNSDEKRTQMSEQNMEEMRRMYENLGVTSSVPFVLEGPSFTRERVAESSDGVHYPPPVYDAGLQIIFNALDWLMPTSNSDNAELYLPKPGSLGIPYLGLMMICVSLIGLFFFDGYYGLSYLAQLFVMKEAVSPGDLYDTAFSPIFKRLKISSGDERVQDTSSYDDRESHEIPSAMGRSTSSLSRRR